LWADFGATTLCINADKGKRGALLFGNRAGERSTGAVGAYFLYQFDKGRGGTSPDLWCTCGVRREYGGVWVLVPGQGDVDY
jgi:hypothetical protein